MPNIGIKSWVQPVKALRDLLKSCNLKGSLVSFPYRWPDGVKAFSSSSNIQRVWKYYQGVIRNTYYGGHIRTDHHVISSMPEDVSNHFVVPNLTIPVQGALRKVLDNDITPRDKIPLNGLVMTKGKYVGASKMVKTGM